MINLNSTTFDKVRILKLRLMSGIVLLLGAFTGASSATAHAQTAPVGRHMLRLDQVAGALSAAMLPLEGAEVRLLAQISATTPEPKLEVKELEAWGDRSARVRLHCETAEQCLPFYVAIEWADAPSAQAALRAASWTSGSLKPGASTALAAVHPVQQGRGAAGPAGNATGSSTVSSKLDAHAAMMHPGSHATLILDGDRLHIKVPVICLEAGNPGSTIRVTALDRKQSYRAEIIDNTLLKGTL